MTDVATPTQPGASSPGDDAADKRVLASDRRARRAQFVLRFGTLTAFALVLLVFYSQLTDTYFTWENVRGILTLAAPALVIAVALTLPLRVGDFDLSLGNATQLYGAFAVLFMSSQGLSTWTSIVLTLVIALVIGAAMGLVIAYSKVNAFVITLAAGSVMLGAEIVVTGNREITDGITEEFLQITRSSVLGVPVSILVAAACLVLVWIVQDRMILGRNIAAVGSSQEAARLSGVRVELVRAAAFSIVGVACAVAGILIASQAAAYYTNAASSMLLPAYAACFLGSTILRPGTFHVVGTAIGVVFLEFVQNGIVQLNWSSGVSNMVQGGILIAAVLTAVLGRRATR